MFCQNLDFCSIQRNWENKRFPNCVFPLSEFVQDTGSNVFSIVRCFTTMILSWYLFWFAIFLDYSIRSLTIRPLSFWLRFIFPSLIMCQRVRLHCLVTLLIHYWCIRMICIAKSYILGYLCASMIYSGMSKDTYSFLPCVEGFNEIDENQTSRGFSL